VTENTGANEKMKIVLLAGMGHRAEWTIFSDKVNSNEQKISFGNIFGGIACILGLVGIGAYFNHRRKKK